MSRLLAAVLLILPWQSPAFRPPPPEKTTQKPLRVDVNLKQIVVTVTDPNGNRMTNLGSEDFVVELDGQILEVSHFRQDTDNPVTLGLLIDTSGSVAKDSQRAAALDGAGQFVKGMLNGDQFFLMTFTSDADLRQDLTDDSDKVEKALQRVKFRGGGTNIPRSVFEAVEKATDGAHRRRALVVITDGVSHLDCQTEVEFRARIRSSELLVYGIMIYDGTPETLASLRPRSNTS